MFGLRLPRPAVSVLGLALVFLSPVASSARAGEGGLEMEAIRGWSIVVSEDASPAERYAAQEFNHFLRETTGFDLRTASEPSGNGNVYIGPSRALTHSRLGFDLSNYGEEAYRIRVTRRAIVIAGGRPRGTLYGVYAFVEDCLGVRFLTAEHTHVPYAPDRMIPREDKHYAPPFSFRWSYYRETTDAPEFATRLRINTLTDEPRLGGRTSQRLITHSIHLQVPVATYGATHPEYFALVEGERLLEVGGGGPQVCSTNPDVVRLVSEAVLREIEAYPGIGNVSVSPNDNERYCTCPTCAAIDAREGTPMGAHLTLVNAVARRVAQQHPEVKVGTLAYAYTRKPPRFLRPRDNVQIQLCSFEACNLHPLEDPSCPENAAFMADFRGWCSISEHIYLWHYMTNLRYLDLPYPNLAGLGPNVQTFRRKGVEGVFLQGNNVCPAGEMSDLRNYLAARLLWNPDLEPRKLIEEFLQLHYGATADTIRKYIELVQSEADRRAIHADCWALPAEVGLSADVARRSAELFDRALVLANDARVHTRVEKIAVAGWKALFETSGRLTYEPGTVRLVYPDNVLQGIPRYADLCKKFGMTGNSEFNSAEEYLNDLRNHLAGARALRLEDATWRLTLLPDMNGAVVDLLHKPSKHNYLRGWDSPNINLPVGTIQAIAFRDFRTFEAVAPSIEAHDDRARLVQVSADGSRIVRTFELTPGPESKVQLSVRIDHRGAALARYQVRTEAEFTLASRESRSIPGNLRVSRGSDPERLAATYMTLATSETSPALRLVYETGQFGEATSDFMPGPDVVAVALPTKTVSLRRGGSFRCRIEFADAAPVLD